MTACDRLARVGFDLLLARAGGPTPVNDECEAVVAAAEAAALQDHARVRELLLASAPRHRSGDANGAHWLDTVLTWPDRLPGLKTWAGQSTLPKIIAAHQKRLAAAGAGDLFAATGWYRTGKGEGPSGFDPLTCQDARDVGFSPSKLGVDIACRPAVELLAVVGLESVPLVSFGARECGFLHAGRVWRFTVEPREGGYFYRWGACGEWLTGAI